MDVYKEFDTNVNKKAYQKPLKPKANQHIFYKRIV